MFLLAFVLLGVAQAQETKSVPGGLAREMALGGSPTNAYLMDYSDIYTNPAWAVKYGDVIYSELGYDFVGCSASGQSAGFTYAIWKELSVGLSIGKQEGPLFGQNSYGSQLGGNAANADNFLVPVNSYFSSLPNETYSVSSNTLRPLQVYGALKMANLTLGLAFYRVSYSATDDYTNTSVGDSVNTTNEVSIGQTGFKAGVLFDMDVMLLDASALLRFNSATGKNTPPPLPAPALSPNREVDATGTEFGLNARLFIKLSDKFSLVPMARLYTFGYEPELKEAVAAGYKFNAKPDKYSRTDFEVGIGSNITVPGGRVFAGLSLESISLKHNVTSFVSGGFEVPTATATQTTNYTSSILSLPKVNLGAEFEIASWLTGRLGYFKAYATETNTTEAPAPAKKQEYKGTFEFKYMPSCSLAVADQLLSLGIGLHFNRLSIDGYLCEEWLADGPFILSGANANSGGNKMFGVLSMSYNFN